MKGVYEELENFGQLDEEIRRTRRVGRCLDCTYNTVLQAYW